MIAIVLPIAIVFHLVFEWSDYVEKKMFYLYR